jgi:tetratricopeptide (TPR) repeat protein
MSKRILLLFFLALLTRSTTQAGVSDTIITMPFENLSGRAEYNWVGESFAGALADLLDTPGLGAIRPDERNVAYKQEGLPPSAILTRATMIKIAERAGANLVVMGTYRVAGEGRDSTITITARVVDILEGRLVGREFSRGGPLVDLQKLQGELAYEILYQHNPALPFSKDQITSRATVAPIGAFENFIKGILTKDRDARINFLEHAIKEYGDKVSQPYIPAIFELGRVYYEANEYAEAIEQLSKVEEKDPRYDEAQFYLAVAQDAVGQTAKALPAHKVLATRLPLYEVYNNIGVFLIKQKQYQEAADHLKAASDAAPRDTETLFNLGYAYYLARDYPQAIVALRTEIERRPSDGEAFYILGKALVASGDAAAAVGPTDQAKKLLPAYAEWETRGPPVLARIKTTFSKANYYRFKREQAERQTPASLSGPSTPADQLLEAARNAFFAGRDDETLTALGNLLQIAPQNYEAHLLMGRVYERRGDFDRATNALKAAIFWNPRLVAAHVLLGRISILKGDCDAAQAAMTRAIQSDPSDQGAQALQRLVEQKCKSGS